MKNQCCVCANFTAYYTKGYCCFLRTDSGHCEKTNQTVKKHGSCALYKTKFYPRKIKNKFIFKELETVLTKLNGLKLILDENNAKKED